MDRDPQDRPREDRATGWNEAVCAEGKNHVGIAGETYFMSGDGYLMTTGKGQAPPDLRYFKQSQH